MLLLIGLFHKAIAMGGSILGNWPIENHQMHLAKKQAKLIGCPEDNSANIMKCLKTKTAQELTKSVDIYRVKAWFPDYQNIY